MTQLISQEGSDSRLPSTNQIDLDTFKAVLFWLNGKRDTQIEILKGKRQVELSEIFAINQKINEKVGTHDCEISFSTFNIILDNGKVLEFGTWGEFERFNWNNINVHTKSVNLTWDLIFKIQNQPVPLKHTVKLRLGELIPPKDMFQLMMSTDNPQEIIEAQANGIIKVDFIKQSIGGELLNLVKEWYEGLPKVKSIGTIQSFLRKNKGMIVASVGNFTPVVILLFYTISRNWICKKYNYSTELNSSNLNEIILILIFVFTIGILAGKFFARWIDGKIGEIQNFNGFLITKGDKNINAELTEKNKAAQNSILIKLGVSITATVIGVLLKYFLKI